jgi:8-oxo-dGTP pyrophosphatase MutT (NUDIX family)
LRLPAFVVIHRFRCATTLLPMTLWIDPPVWPAHGHRFAHLVSDTCYDELHELAARADLPRRAFDGDHYDVPEQRWRAVVAAGAEPTSGLDLVRRLNASGLRLRKRKGDRGIVRHRDLPVLGSRSDIDLVFSRRPVPEQQAFAAMVFIRDAAGSFVTVHSIRRGEWGSPGGWREPGESPVENAVRETWEETGLRLDPHDLVPCGYERFTPRTEHSVLLAQRPYLQVFRMQLSETAPGLTDGDSGIRETRWATPGEYAALCGTLFWWPLAEAVFPELVGGRR